MPLIITISDRLFNNLIDNGLNARDALADMPALLTQDNGQDLI